MSRPTPSKAKEKVELEDYGSLLKKFGRPDLEKKSEVTLIGYSDIIETLKLKISRVFTGQLLDFTLVTGPSGTGKTTVVRKIAETYHPKLNYIYLKASWMLQKRFGNPECQIDKIFEEAIDKSPSLIFIDDIHRICENKRSQPDANRIFDVLTDKLECLLGLSAKVLVIVATDKADLLDAEIRKPRYFKDEIKFKLPNRQDRLEMLNEIFARHKIKSETTRDEMEQIADLTHCYLYSDLEDLCKNALAVAAADKDEINFQLLRESLSKFKPTAIRNVTTPCPPLRWEDIGGVENVKRELQESVIWPLEHREKFKRLGIVSNKGAILYGPPGCSKTMLAQALATESGYNFISVKGPELFSKWVGDSEAAVRKLYSNAREIAPCIIFFDEIDGFASERSDKQSSSVGDKVVAQLLTELNGIEPLDNVFTIAATNRPDRVDSALMRPGRLDPAIYIPLPAEGDRVEIFKVHMRPLALVFEEDQTVDSVAARLAARTGGYSGAEIANVCRVAGQFALRESLENEHIHWRHFEMALNSVKPRTRIEHLKAYSKFHERSLQLGQRSSLAMTPLQFCDDFDSKINLTDR